jgi:hypothetical protein
MLLGILTLAMCPLPTFAQPRPCEEDAKKLCPDAKPGSGAIRKCLEEHRDQLSEACRQRISQSRGRRQGYPPRFQGCEADLDKYCKETPPGGGRLLNCLREHEKDLSEECKKGIAERRGGGGRGKGGGGGRGGGQGKRTAGANEATKAPDSTPKPK